MEHNNAAAFAAGQAAWDNAAPDYADDGAYDDQTARDQAIAELLTTAEPAADWIAKACDYDQGRAPINTLHIGGHAILECTSVPVLLALILNGTAQQQVRAADRLAYLYRTAETPWIAQRAAELLEAA